jgi:hypothetical protein
MSFDTLIDRLADDLQPVRPRRLWMDVGIMALISVVELVLLFAIGFANLDLHRLQTQPTVGWRLVSLGLISVAAGFAAIRSFDPTFSAKRSVRRLGVIIALSVLGGLFLGTLPGGLAALVQRLAWTDGIHCAARIAVLSLPPLAGLLLLCCRGAPTDMHRTRLLVGLAAAAWGAFSFVFSCPFNDPVFILTWYTLGCVPTMLAARYLMPVLARW